MTVRQWVGLAAVGMVVSACGVTLGQAQTGVTPPPATGPAPASQPGSTQPAEGAPRMELSPPGLEFGQVWQGALVKRDYTIKNTGNAPMTIAVKSNCGCTVATKPKTPLPAGETTTFTITYDTSRPGPVHKVVTITTNDPARPPVNIDVKGEVKPLYAATPADSIVFQDLEASSIETQTITLASKYDGPLNLKLKEGQDFGAFEIALKEIKPGQEYQLTATTKPPLRYPASRTTVILETGLPAAPKVEITVVANAQPRVLVTPLALYSMPEPQQPSPQPVRVQYRVNTPLKITEVKATPASVKFEILPSEQPPGQDKIAFYIIRVTLPPFADVPAEGGKLDIFTDDKSPEYQHLSVPIVKRTLPAQGRPLATPPSSRPTPPPGVGPR